MNKYIRTILAVVLTVISYIPVYGETGTSGIRAVLDEVKEVIKEKPDSTFAVLKALDVPESEDEDTKALYAVLSATAEYISSGKIESDSLLLKAIGYYGKTKSNESAQAHYYLGCYYFSYDYEKAIDAFNTSIKHCPNDDDDMKGRVYHAVGTCWFAIGDYGEYVKACKKALSYFEGNENEEIRLLCQRMKYNINMFTAMGWVDKDNGSIDNDNASIVLYVVLALVLLCGLGICIYIVTKRKKDPDKASDAEPVSSSLEKKLKEGRSALEMTSAYRILLEIRSLNEGELQARNDIDASAIEDAVLASFYDAYQILAESEEKISRQDLLLCLYGYLRISNNVIAFLLKSVPTTIRQRRKRLQGKLSPEAYQILFS